MLQLAAGPGSPLAASTALLPLAAQDTARNAMHRCAHEHNPRTAMHTHTRTHARRPRGGAAGRRRALPGHSTGGHDPSTRQPALAAAAAAGVSPVPPPQQRRPDQSLQAAPTRAGPNPCPHTHCTGHEHACDPHRPRPHTQLARRRPTAPRIQPIRWVACARQRSPLLADSGQSPSTAQRQPILGGQRLQWSSGLNLSWSLPFGHEQRITSCAGLQPS